MWGLIEEYCMLRDAVSQLQLLVKVPEKIYTERSTAGQSLEMPKVSWTSTSTHSKGKGNCSSHSLAANSVLCITAIQVNNYLHIHILLVSIGTNKKRNYIWTSPETNHTKMSLVFSTTKGARLSTDLWTICCTQTPLIAGRPFHWHTRKSVSHYYPKLLALPCTFCFIF